MMKEISQTAERFDAGPLDRTEDNIFRASDSKQPRWETAESVHENNNATIDARYTASLSKNPLWNAHEVLQRPVPIRTAYGETITNNIDRIVEGPDAEIRALWQKYKDKVTITKPGYKGNEAYYSCDEGGVTQNIEVAAKGDAIDTPYQVSFHEFGHNIDYLINRTDGDGKPGKFFSESYKDGLLGKTAKQEAESFLLQRWKEHRDKTGQRLLPEKFYSMVQKELMTAIPLLERGDISDIFEGATNGKLCLGAGHGKEYWQHRDNGKEVFAEMFSASICNFGSLNNIKKYFPETYKVFQEMVKIAGGKV
ncbi:hypothetical protein AGMMS49579_09180 [Spirochaetia bacterium]|nr:hypothetical protein AGMMS49579_09180 [Spirochaetia bacterium]